LSILSGRTRSGIAPISKEVNVGVWYTLFFGGFEERKEVVDVRVYTPIRYLRKIFRNEEKKE